ncbi:proline--tRNA ligase [Candidatus Woesearchaeota archaeon]|nr:proline--tRNA ligase [Candidatus Woesearchaeota archaeon]
MQKKDKKVKEKRADRTPESKAAEPEKPAKDKQQLGLTVKKSEDFSEWYTQVVSKAELADYSAVSGCMVFRPDSYAVWERIQSFLDTRFKSLGVRNVYFPMFIPESLFKRESEHVAGFKPEVAWVTMAGDTELSERLAIRPTSETIMYDSFGKWIRSWRDLPLLLNQWCSVVRWEFKYPKPFLRTREFLWQEGHTVHESKDDADRQAMAALNIYKELIEDVLAIPVLAGKKSEAEKFAGALYTTALESLMPDGRCLQMVTSHNLGQNFAKAFNIRFLGKDGKEALAWQTSWGATTRLIGALIMVHGDDKGLVLPPKIAPVQVVVVPIVFGDDKEGVLIKCRALASQLKVAGYSVVLDERSNYSPGWKFNQWELKGVPLRVEIGPKDVQAGKAVVVRRDSRAKEQVAFRELAKRCSELLASIQSDLFAKAKRFLDDSIVDAKDWKGLMKGIESMKIVKAFFCNSTECEAGIKESSGGASSRVIPFDGKKGPCVRCGKPGVLACFGKSY